MFQNIQYSRTENEKPIYAVNDSCFSFELIAESHKLESTIIHSACAEALVAYYESKHLNVAKNLALYYKWANVKLYGSPVYFVLDMWLDNHCVELNTWAPRYKFGTKYVPSIKQYLKNMGCYQL